MWYSIGKNWPFGQENKFCAKKTPQNQLFLCARIGVTWLLKDLDAKRLTPYVPENFQREKFSGLLPTESLRTQDSENVVGLGDQASVSKL